MTRPKRLEQPSRSLSPAELGDFLRAPPPAFLDALVKQRVGQVLEQRRVALAGQRADARRPWPSQRDEPLPSSPALDTSTLHTLEAWTYALGFLAYGAQLADGVARMIWRAMTG
jgi:hypothetical protein